MTRLEIREPDLTDPGDAQGVVEVLDSYATDPVGGGQPLRSDVRERLIPALREQPNSLVLLAFDDEQASGIAVWVFGFSTFQARPLLNIHDWAGGPGHRGKGVGRALLLEAEKQALGRGCCKLTLEVQEGNLTARSLYDRFGFADFVVGDSGPTRFLSKALPQ
jgi:GNAT superfamily N-acetyltransferase